MKSLNQKMTVLGTVADVQDMSFTLHLRTDDDLSVWVGAGTSFMVLSNLDGLTYDRFPEPENVPVLAEDDDITKDIKYKIRKYVRSGQKMYVQGTFLQNDGKERFEALMVRLFHYEPGKFLFEHHTHWWLSQMATMADEWLQDLFGDSRKYDRSDFSRLYRTNLNLYGGKTDDDIQAMATLSRLIYGLSSAYLLLGDRRYLDAAAAGVEFQRTAFRSLSHDGLTILWSHARKKLVNGTLTYVPSQVGDDKGTIPLYEQIYALAGMTQFYRITGDPEVLDDIKRTVRAFNTFFQDNKDVVPDYPGKMGYFSHIDPATMRADSPALAHNRLRKNWNSIGDHIPAYLVNLILALDPLPQGAGKDIERFVKKCKDMLDLTTGLIINKFPEEGCPYVNERFFADWTPDHNWQWQQNRAIVGHNLKIAWNLTRVANYYRYNEREEDARRAMRLAEQLGKAMIDAGLDKVRGGCYDAVERKPKDGREIQFVWGNHKDFWQQEQNVLAYLILYAYTQNDLYRDLFRDSAAWWNTFQLDRDNRGVFFRVSDNGDPFISGRGMAGYDIAGYHSFELNFLAHIYLRTYVCADSGRAVRGDRVDAGADFCLYFRPAEQSQIQSLNVLPDFVSPGILDITSVKVNGRERKFLAQQDFQIPLQPDELGKEIVVSFRSRRLHKQ
jgi:mannose/cellobiose epimerase-like protein (N-acyl-D-glucosamine 2-epimerase family)